VKETKTVKRHSSAAVKLFFMLIKKKIMKGGEND